MTLKIDKPKLLHTDCYVVSVEYMFGDADGKENVKTVFNSTEHNEAEDFYKFMSHIINHQNNNWNDYEKLQQYAKDKIIDDTLLTDSNLLTFLEKKFGSLEEWGIGELIKWPDDPFTDYQSPAIPRRIEICYFDKDGIEYSVKVV